MRVTLPESVHRYCTDDRIRSAVDLLLSRKSPKMPDGLQWNEVQDFYRACLAAQQTQIEWALALESVWTAIFADQTVGWRPSSISQQTKDSSIRLDVEYLWENGEFTRDLVRADHYLQALVELHSDNGLRIAMGLWSCDQLIDVNVLSGFRVIDGWLYSGWEPFNETLELDIGRLRSLALAAVKATDATVIAAA